MGTLRPIKILTLGMPSSDFCPCRRSGRETLLTFPDGGGLQALAALSSLNAVCRAIADQNGADRPPKPDELFDIIGGVGTGG
jgi:hypothetical protein